MVFVGGVHRSGTTVIANAVATHPEISGLSNTGVPENEGQHLQHVYSPARAYGGFGRFGFADESHLTEDSVGDRTETRKRLLEAWTPYWDTSKPILLEKSPPNLLKTRFLQELFPRSHFVVVVRHPIAVMYATHKIVKPWERIDLGRYILHWLKCHETLVEDMPYLTGLTMIRYEDFMANPNAELARLYKALGLRACNIAVDVRAGLNERYFRSWEDGRGNPAKHLYRRWLVRRYEERVRQFGYSLADPTALRQMQIGSVPRARPSVV